MAFSATIYRVFIASPGDVVRERAIVQEAIHWWNSTHGVSMGVILQPVMWEIDSTPEVGSDPQDLLNRQLLPNCDILIGIFWSRIGTATPRAASGTVEEIEQFIDTKRPTAIYFSKQDIPQTQLKEIDQYTKLQNFKESCRKRAVYREFESQEGLSTLLQNHLHRIITALLQRPPTDHKGDSTTEIQTMEPVIERVAAEVEVLQERMNENPEGSLAQTDHLDDEEIGILDLSEMAMNAINRAAQHINALNLALRNVASQMAEHGRRINAAKAAGATANPSNSKELLNAAAADLETFGTSVADIGREMGKEYSTFITSLRGILKLAGESGLPKQDRTDLRKLMSMTSSFGAVIDGTRQGMRSLRSSIASLQPMTGKIKRAKRIATAALDDLDSQLDQIGRWTSDLNIALEEFLEQHDHGSDESNEPKDVMD